MPVSKDVRVRMDGFANTIAIVFPSSGRPSALRPPEASVAFVSDARVSSASSSSLL